MHIISRKKLREFWEQHRDAEGPLRAWYADAKKANWEKPTDITAVCCNARPIPNNRVIFDIGGNKYRLVVAIRYSSGRVLVRFIGTHQDYDRIDATTV
jgi:mRNA interferase HigB